MSRCRTGAAARSSSGCSRSDPRCECCTCPGTRTRSLSTRPLLTPMAGFCRSHFWPMHSSISFARLLDDDASNVATTCLVHAVRMLGRCGGVLPNSMTLAEIFLLIAGGTGIYFLLTPLQRGLERYLIRRFFTRHRRLRRPTIDVTDFTSYESNRKEDHHK